MDRQFDAKNVADRITVVGELEHLYYHAKKSASTTAGTDDEPFHLELAAKTKAFRRAYMSKYFPECPDELWCEGKAVEAMRQRVYEADEGDATDLAMADELWAMVWGQITGLDLYGCASCAEDRESEGEDEE